MGPAISKTENGISELEVDMGWGLCPECKKPYPSSYQWCNQCNAKQFQKDFLNWTSGNNYIDNFIQETQLNAKRPWEVLEWIPYNRLTNIKYLAKGGFSTVYNAIWLDGYITDWDNGKKQWKRYIKNYSV